DPLCHILDTCVSVHIDGKVFFKGSLFGSDYDNAISASGSINGGSGSILEHLDRCYIIGVDKVDVVQQHSVHYKQRVGVVQGADSPDPDSRDLSRGTGSRSHLNAADPTL